MIRLERTTMQSLSIAIATLFSLGSLLIGQERASGGYPPNMPEAKVEVYKSIGDVKLNMYIFAPEGHKPADQRPAIVFFFGGGWQSGTPGQFHQQCRYLASRGMVAMAADYRVRSRHSTPAVRCVADGKSAIRWVRAHSKRLGIDPNRIAAGGGSAGGHVAACTATIEPFDEANEDKSVSSKPNALALFNPALVLAPVGGESPFGADMMAGLAERMGVDPVALSPYHHVKKGNPPTIIFHGKADTTVPYRTAELFAAAMKKAGNDCELHGYDGETHGFFNFGRGGGKAYAQTVAEMDRFFVRLGYLQGEPKVAEKK
jgi:acetyl esterase/lipase